MNCRHEPYRCHPTAARVSRLRSVLAVAALLLAPAEILAQGGFGPGGGGSPSGGGGPLFGGEKQKKVVHGPSLAVTDEVVVDIRIEGNKTVPTARILGQMQTKVGRPYDPEAFKQDVRNLVSQQWLVDVRPLSESTEAGRVIVLRVVERPVIRYVEYLGNEGVSDRKLAKESGLKVGGAVDPFGVEQAKRRIEDYYQDQGFDRVEVSVIEGTQPSDQGVVFVISEGNKQKVWGVEFEGNTFLSDSRLKTKIKSKPGFLYLFGGKLNREELDADVNRLTEFYRSFGFFRARVGRLVEVNDGSSWATLRFVINEGQRYNVRTVRFMGNEKFTGDALASISKLPSGEPFEQAKMNADVEKLKEVYGSEGHIFADVRAEPVFLEQPGEIDLVYHIDEGKRFRIGRIFVHIEGDRPHTRIQTAINRLGMQPGDIADIRDIRDSERRLMASRLFNTDPSQGDPPRITFQIPEFQEEFTAEGERPTVRGQSPAPAPVQPANYQQTPTYRARGFGVYEVERPVLPPDGDEPIDVHLVYDKNGNLVPMPAAPVAPATAAPIIRGQSPAATSGWTNPPPPAAAAPASIYQQSLPPAAAPVYGGTLPAATDPASSYAGQGYAAPAAPQAYGAPASAYQTQPYQAQQIPSQPFAAQPAASQPGGVQPAQFVEPRHPQMLPPGVVGAPLTNPNQIPDRQDGGPFGIDPFSPVGNRSVDPYVDLTVRAGETQTGRFMVGVGVNSDAGVTGQILLDEQNFDWRRVPRSWQDWSDGTAFRGAGQHFRIEANPGTQVQRYAVSFQEPYLWDTPISLGLSGSYFQRQYRDWSEDRLGGRTSLGYQWTANDLSGSLSYRGEQIEIYDIPLGAPQELTEVLGTNQLHGFSARFANDTRDNPFLATQGHYLELTVEQVLGSFTYPRATIDARQYFLLNERPDHSGRHTVMLATQLGFTGANTPIYDHFFAGGYSTLRGFDFRGASPVKNGVEVGGEFQWLNTAQYMFPLTADDMIHGVAFCDFGTVEENVEIENLRVSPGVGLRITVPAMGPAPIALDFAWPIQYAPTDDREVFTFFIGFMR
ncbi:Outer membrane protein assembly factor BamA precursor [Pirellulimonas nuda]|uniref:Outer membrane protein assembly factor BamA n=1 Tax=Pirellulimonas nuda TaxID=2528009 RepID=A0A518DGD3_9BACT|nr:BamA/TamA family outer membrane protein [Pirellulimonas nuda]QDU90534.1 Outer membrane protein assembly factor BamA precursor [Pirellulimonas nuda]